LCGFRFLFLLTTLRRCFSRSATADGTNAVVVGSTRYEFGAQTETGSVATSYIPTTTASAPRQADVNVKTGVASLIGQEAGTIYVECSISRNDQTTDRAICDLSDGSANNRILLTKYRNGRLQCYIRTGAVDQAIIFPATIYDNDKLQIAVTYETNKATLYVNGSEVGEDLSVSLATYSVIGLGCLYTGSNTFNDHPSLVALFKEALTDEEIASIPRIT